MLMSSLDLERDEKLDTKPLVEKANAKRGRLESLELMNVNESLSKTKRASLDGITCTILIESSFQASSQIKFASRATIKSSG